MRPRFKQGFAVQPSMRAPAVCGGHHKRHAGQLLPLRRPFQELINRHMDELAASVTREQGKTLADARGDVFRGLGEPLQRGQSAMPLGRPSPVGLDGSGGCPKSSCQNWIRNQAGARPALPSLHPNPKQGAALFVYQIISSGLALSRALPLQRWWSMRQVLGAT